VKTEGPWTALLLVLSALLAALGGRVMATELPRGVASFETVKVAGWGV
jgi:hypothetical protein